uniref:Kringle domain-containing protein n=1 Tax=Haemonchus contortus TaxID=6289 RepID=A0A7I4YXH6_HAECO
MRIRTFVCFHLVLCCNSALYENDLYFDSSDEKRAECIESSELSTYNYLGDRSHTISGEQCLIWKEVYDITIKELEAKDLKIYKENVAPEEVMLHNKCRTFNLHTLNPRRTALKFQLKGPWCYIRKKKGEIGFERCFDICRGQPREEKTELGKSQYGEKQMEKNYNDELIENIQKYYRSYTWGEVSYYRWKPSDDSFSAEYYRMREQIFYGCVGTVVFLILWLLMCSYLRKEAAAARRRREQAIKMIFPNRKIQMHPVIRPHVS